MPGRKDDGSAFHVPVLREETLEYLVQSSEGVYVDATLGGGGHAAEILKGLAEKGQLIGIDRDPEAVAEARGALDCFANRVQIFVGLFWNLKEILQAAGISKVAGILFDLGVSSHQIDSAGRGFSFQQDGPLDMRMGPDSMKTAAEILNTYTVAELEKIFRGYGEERAAGRIARTIGRLREDRPVRTTSELADLISHTIAGPHKTKSQARIFQALRIEVNEELAHLEDALQQAIEMLQPGGRLAVLSYHSLEDRIVKDVVGTAKRGCICPPNLPVCGCGRTPTMEWVSRRTRASDLELARNPRSRSATLRVAQRIEISPS